MKNGNLYMQIKLLRPSENLFSGFQTASFGFFNPSV